MEPAELFRLYEAADAGPDGYPTAWHRIGEGVGLKHIVRARAGDRCLRCGHPYSTGMGEWSWCDEHCTHGSEGTRTAVYRDRTATEAQWRILTVHHLNEIKVDCRWWNLVALCQRCHLNVQRRVKMDRPWPWPHTAWFLPYVAGYYAWHFGGWDLTRDEVEKRLDELLALGARESAVERMPL